MLQVNTLQSFASHLLRSPQTTPARIVVVDDDGMNEKRLVVWQKVKGGGEKKVEKRRSELCHLSSRSNKLMICVCVCVLAVYKCEWSLAAAARRLMDLAPTHNGGRQQQQHKVEEKREHSHRAIGGCWV